MSPEELEEIRARAATSTDSEATFITATGAISYGSWDRLRLLALVDEQALALRRATGLARIIDGHLLDLTHIVDPETVAAR